MTEILRPFSAARATQADERFFGDSAADDGGRFDDRMAAIGSAPAMRFELIPFHRITYADGPLWLVKGLLPTTGLATIFGPPKQYKSFVAADLALHIAAGTDWAGRRVRQGVVVYIVGEGSTGFANRIAANRQKFEYPNDLPFFLIKARPNLGVGEGDRLALIAAIDAVVPSSTPIAAIFIDTLARMLAGSSENDEGMRNFTDNAEAISDHFACLAIAVHHTGKNQAAGMRGSSSLHGAVVTSWKVEKAKDFQARISLEDAKDGESGLTWTADFEHFAYRIDEDGDEEATLLVREISEPRAEGTKIPSSDVAPTSTRLPASLKLFMSCLSKAMGSDGRMARPFLDGPEIKIVSLDAVRAEYMKARKDEASDDAKRKGFGYAQKAGVEREVILIRDLGGEKIVWTARAE